MPRGKIINGKYLRSKSRNTFPLTSLWWNGNSRLPSLTNTSLIKPVYKGPILQPSFNHAKTIQLTKLQRTCISSSTQQIIDLKTWHE